jgi:hypothetical protein
VIAAHGASASHDLKMLARRLRNALIEQENVWVVDGLADESAVEPAEQFCSELASHRRRSQTLGQRCKD